MEPTRIQTVLRLPPELMERVRRNARKEKKSFNSYVEAILAQAAGPVFPVLPTDYEISEEIRKLGCLTAPEPSAEALAADPRLAWLWEKYGRD